MSVSTRGPSSGELDDYANSMFRFERLHDGWIDQCAAYLRSLFGKSLEGATVLDYAFGRGNWSVAFRRAGAERVVSVDASRGNVDRFRRYLDESGTDGVEVIHGNIVEAPIEIAADLLWVYGVLHHIPEVDRFLEALRPMARSDASVGYFYAYDSGSLREAVVEACRRYATYESEAAFRRDGLLFTPSARRRVQDDLTAPHIGWYTVDGMTELLGRHGFHATRRDSDFGVFQRGHADEEFQPHQLLCSLAGSSNGTPLVEPARPHSSDVDLLRSLMQLAFEATPEAERRDLAIGLTSTHFTACAAGDFEHVLREDFGYLVYALLTRDAADPASLPDDCAEAMTLALAAMSGEERSELGRRDRSIDRYFREHTLRV